MQQLNIQEIHQRLLELAKVFDEICTRHSIPYYMLGGTMLGAIRHKGFIPWDDDMDFGVPRRYYKEIMRLLEEESPKQYQCCSYLNHSGIITPFFKFSDMETVICDPRVQIPLEDQVGVNIDIFPLDICDNENTTIKLVLVLNKIYNWIYVNNAYCIKWKNSLKKIARKICPISPKSFHKYSEKLLEKLTTGRCWGNVYGAWGKKEIVPIEWYGGNIRYQFENMHLCGLREYNKYLTHLYGNYMQLPPKDKRIVHADKVYLRE